MGSYCPGIGFEHFTSIKQNRLGLLTVLLVLAGFFQGVSNPPPLLAYLHT